MELIPILATIILVATISTFFLSIGAYILYKVREARGVKATVAPPATIQAELVTPESQYEQMPMEPVRITASPAFEQQQMPGYQQREPMVRQQPMAAPYQARVSLGAQQYTVNRNEAPAPGARMTDGGRKFVKLTSETPEKPKEQAKNGGALKWR